MASRGFLAMTLAATALSGQPVGDRAGKRDLTEIGLEELMNIEVTSVSKKGQRLSRVPAAIYVITQEEIRRSTATTIPELLRMAPGLEVARIDANQWAISARGFNGRWSNKLLVMIDGRTVFSPIFSGVYWDVQDTLLEDIDRIEVIRGPGSTMWGANAVNGVINILTRHARETQGALVSAAAGNEERAAAVRYGGRTGRVWWRGYGKLFDRGPSERDYADGRDGWRAGRGGFRVDWERSERDGVMLAGDVYDARSNQLAQVYSLEPPFARAAPDEARSVGGSLAGRWRHVSRGGSETTVQAYFDRAQRRETLFDLGVDTYDVELQHRRTLGRRHDLQWGVQGRHIRDRVKTSMASVAVPKRNQSLYGSSVQDEILLVEDRLYLTAGLKVEHNFMTGYEVQPGIQLLWTPDSRHTVWSLVERAVSTPARIFHDASVDFVVVPGPQGIPVLVEVLPSARARSEALQAHEAGYRVQLTKRAALDVSGFYNIYTNLSTREARPGYMVFSPPPMHFVSLWQFDNKLGAHTAGVEIAARMNAASRWRIDTSYSWLHMRMLPNGTTAEDPYSATYFNPGHQFQVRSYLDLSKRLTFDTTLYAVGGLHNPDPAYNIPRYFRIDARLGWLPTSGLEASLACENAANTVHPEFWARESLLATGNRFGRSIYAKLTWRF